MDQAHQHLQDKLEKRKLAGNYRQLRTGDGLVDLYSNDQLGFARSPDLRAAIEAEMARYPHTFVGSTGSRLLSGNTAYAAELEDEIAKWHIADSALLFNSGYDANIGLFSSVPQKGDTIIHDELIHASIIDGARLSYAERYSFKHNDLKSLEMRLRNGKGIRYVVVESVYSMDGDSPPLEAMIQLTERYNACLIVDEAHAVGLYPRGLVAEYGLQNRVSARVVTFGKALGCHGAAVLGSGLLRNYLINFARSFIYTTAASFHQLAAIKMAYDKLRNASANIEMLKSRIQQFKGQMTAPSARYPAIMSDSAIQCIILGSNQIAKQTAEALQTEGFDVRPILSPTVPAGAERLRICLHSFNTNNELSLFTSALDHILRND